MISLIDVPQTITYKWKDNKDYMKQYLQRNSYYCQACATEVCFNGINRHVATKKHLYNLQENSGGSEKAILRIKDGEAYYV